MAAMTQRGSRLWIAAALVFACGVLPAGAAPPPVPIVPLAAVLERLAQSPEAPDQYSADVKLHVRLRFFPWISLTLRGNEVYKHPGLYHFVFRGVPKAAEHFSDLAYDLGDATAWPQKYTISLLAPAAPGVDPIVRMMPKRRGMVRTLDVTVNMASGTIQKAVWSRFDGGTITLVQHYDTVGRREVVAEQDAKIRIPHMSADVTATYSNFDVDGGAAAANP